MPIFPCLFTTHPIKVALRIGACASVDCQCAEKQRSDEIDRIIEEDSKKYRTERKIVLLGSGESGKSTIMKQLKTIHQNACSQEELLKYRLSVYQNVVESAKTIVNAMRKFCVDPILSANRVHAHKIIDYKVEASPNFIFSEEISLAIHNLWQDPIIPKIMDHSSEFHLTDSASYFFSEVLRIGKPDYTPTQTDILRARKEGFGVVETRFTVGQRPVQLVDVSGLRSERKKWIHCFESVTAIIFCTALSEYDEVLSDGSDKNRMVESIALFESIVNSRWFLRTSIILVLNKLDVFKSKIPKVPLEKYFPEYTGGPDINKAVKFILRQFMQTNRAGLSVYPHATQATDMDNIRSVSATLTSVCSCKCQDLQY
ncbi:heterotrimeric G protein alpha subunit [Rickenella mellea]|uniref:Heterotrimeric G protein alpha subunit n=1 Tax=Rickenella mellea TaxID=50990 RepID=A0A4Y7PPL6_9AGAM|nr:heterotrimeric G protein alpha subunit [Rickenella mellea]